MAPSSAVVSTLRHVTDDKLAKLALLQDLDRDARQRIADFVEAEPDPAKQVRMLLKEAKKSSSPLLGWMDNVERFVDQAKYDPSVTPGMLQKWRDQLLEAIGWQANRYKYTSLFGKLVTEWIENPNEGQTISLSGTDSDSEDLESTSNFESVGREEMHEQRKQWEEYAFGEMLTDKDAITKYLDGFFLNTSKSRKLKQSPLEQLRESISKWYIDSDLEISADQVKSSIKQLLSTDIFAGQKRQALSDLLHQPAVLAELADVLNSDLASLDQWAWSPSPVSLNMRRQINGKYRVFMDQEIHQAILTQFIGISFAVHLKAAFNVFFNSGAWLQAPHNAMTRRDALRREYFLGNADDRKDYSVREQRRTDFKDRYFLTQLPSSILGGNREYDDVDKNESDDGWEVGSYGYSETPLEMKQKILCLATTESLISRHIYGKSTVMQSDFKWFGPSMPHSTIFAVLDYFRVPQKWVDLFKKFMTPSVCFSQDGKRAEVRTRTRGLPMGHIISDTLGEMLMFCLDFAVNQRTNGGTLYRFHDDLWYWGVPESGELAWKAIVDFTAIMGLALNEEKTGTVNIAQSTGPKAMATPAGLPKGKVEWGFLVLDSASGRWLIDQDEVDKHIVELKRQLSACRSIFAYVQAFNAYVNQFMLNNFGWPAHCLGIAHIDMCIATIKRVQQELFGRDGTITAHLSKTIEERFGVTDLPDAFFYFPEKLGGLNVANPMITLLLKRNEEYSEPDDCVQAAIDDDQELYEAAKALFEVGKVKTRNAMAQRAVELNEEFMSLEEYTSFREECSRPLGKQYEHLQTTVDPQPMPLARDICHCRSMLDTDTRETLSKCDDSTWVLELYGSEALRLCGDLRLGERKMLPLGLLSMMKSEKVRWQG